MLHMYFSNRGTLKACKPSTNIPFFIKIKIKNVIKVLIAEELQELCQICWSYFGSSKTTPDIPERCNFNKHSLAQASPAGVKRLPGISRNEISRTAREKYFTREAARLARLLAPKEQYLDKNRWGKINNRAKLNEGPLCWMLKSCGRRWCVCSAAAAVVMFIIL
jgi:hypothetical protein